MKAYKAFNDDWTCRGYQFEVGGTYECSGEVVVCENGFHACENPFDVLNYYDLIGSKFAMVNADGDVSTGAGDTKFASAKITIEAELSLPDFVKACVDWLLSRCSRDASSGDYAKLASSGDTAQLASSGDYAKLASSGDYAKLASSGDTAQLASSGYSAKLASSGDSAKLASSGDTAQLASSGDSAKLASSGDYGVIASSGVGARAKGAVGTWISLAEYADGKCVGFATGCIGKDGLEPDTLYRASGGRLVKCGSSQ